MNTTCTVCDGTGKMRLKAVYYQQSGDNRQTTYESDLSCMWCNGTGKMTPTQAQDRKRFVDAWCQCGNPSGESDYYQRGHLHGYTCRDCGKITQTG